MYAFPPFCLIGRCLAKIKKDQAKIILINTSVAGTTMGSHSSGNADEPTNLATTIIRYAIITARGTSPAHTEQQPHTGGVESVRRRLRTQGFSEESTALLLDARRPGTIRLTLQDLLHHPKAINSGNFYSTDYYM